MLISPLDKLLGQLGIYATWLSSIAYLHKQLRIFIFFMPRFFFCDHMFSYCMKPSVMCLHIYSLPSSAFLKYQTIVPEANLIPLLTFECVQFAKFHFHRSVFPRNTRLSTDILFIKLELYWALASKKKSIPDWHLFITQMEMKWTKWYAMTSHVIAYRSLELLFCMHTFDFNCFFEDFNCVFTQIGCLSRVLSILQ